MKCLYHKPCSVKRDGECHASIKGYCDFQDKPDPPKPVVEAVTVMADDNHFSSQDQWISETIAKERRGRRY